MINTAELTGYKEPVTHSIYFFTLEEFRKLPVSHQDQFLILDKKSNSAAYKAFASRDMLCGDDAWGNKPFSGGCFKEVQKTQKWKDVSELKKWLFECGVPFKSEALLLPVFSTEDDTAILTTWKMVCKYPEVFFSSDNIVVTDPDLDWCLYYHHDDIMHFAKGWKYSM